jgi:ubiquitin C-terminal hydrolase
MSSYYTTNSTYGAFYKEKLEEIARNNEKRIENLREKYAQERPKEINESINKRINSKNESLENSKELNEKGIPLAKYIIPSLTGLNNLGNTCYINTCLQNLIHCSSFINKFLEAFKYYNNSTPISNTFYNLITEITDNDRFYNKEFISPVEFVETFRNIHSNFEKYQEHDTQEFCRYLLQDFNKELNEVRTPVSYKAELPKNKNKKESYLNYVKYCLSKEKSIITDLFKGFFSFEYTCECGYKEYSFSQFLDLPVQMDANVYGYDLYQMLKNNFYKKSYVDMGENCSFCRRTSKKNESMKIALLPNILIISLQRINPKNGMKNEALVKFYEGIDFSEIIDTEIQRTNSTKYNLFAISNHIGNINSGHYYSQIKINNNWYCFEDSKVYKIGPQIDMNTKEVYTLFYKLA